MLDKIETLNKGLIVSCQALETEPLHSSHIMGRMAIAAVTSGAVGIRSNSPKDITEIKKQVEVPVIGIWKQVYGDSPVFITPTIKEMRAVADTGCEIIACDATLRERPNGEKLSDIIKVMRKEYSDTLLMADCSTVKEAEYACKLGFDFIGTTLHGYTEETEGMNIASDDFLVLKEFIKVSTKPVIAEGKIDTPDKAKRTLDLGCYAVVVGGAITRPQEITQRFVDKIQE